jgi:hypothetical protein
MGSVLRGADADVRGATTKFDDANGGPRAVREGAVNMPRLRFAATSGFRIEWRARATATATAANCTEAAGTVRGGTVGGDDERAETPASRKGGSGSSRGVARGDAVDDSAASEVDRDAGDAGRSESMAASRIVGCDCGARLPSERRDARAMRRGFS